jgi:hypothetical protein
MKKIQLGGHIKGSEIKGYAIVDDEDFDELNKYNWCLNNNYVGRRVTTGFWKSTIVYMHNFLMKTPKGKDTDHINRNKLDNRRENLRVCTRADNNRNTLVRKNSKSGEKHIRFSGDHYRSFPWEVRIKLDNRDVRKNFKTIEDAKEFRNIIIKEVSL